jgi:hypothetical protein
MKHASISKSGHVRTCARNWDTGLHRQERPEGWDYVGLCNPTLLCFKLGALPWAPIFPSNPSPLTEHLAVAVGLLTHTQVRTPAGTAALLTPCAVLTSCQEKRRGSTSIPSESFPVTEPSTIPPSDFIQPTHSQHRLKNKLHGLSP